ncbi:MAG TPA: ABC transporter permease [Rubrobacteraceae bacterium]|nr:ABC transporter permease [Rubrobacteraceae bacterium]
MRLRRFSGIGPRSLRARAQRTLLTAIGIVLGVGIVFGVITLSDTMASTFTDLYSRAFGAADITVTAAGDSGTFDERVVEKVRGYEGVESAAPRLSLPASLVLETRDENGLPEVQSLRLFGVEPESAALATGFELTEGRFPASGKEITLDGGSAESIGLEVGDRVTLGTPRGPEKLELVGILRIPGGSFGGFGFGMAPLPYAREAFDEPGKISGIAVEAAEGTPVPELRERLDRGLGEGLQAQRSETRTREITGQLQGFRISLLFFAGTALFVGAFLVFNALSMTILERTRELGMLRALGSTRAMIGRSVMTEALILGLLGSVLGVLFGYGMAKGLVYLFGRAFLFQITTLTLSPFALVSAVVVGVAVTAIAALYPALRAGRVSPVEAMRSRAGGSSGRRSRVWSVLTPLFGLALLGAGAPWIYYLAKNLSADLDGLVYASGIAAVIGAFLGVSLVIPVLVRPLAALFSPILRLLFGVEGRMAAANATRNTGRTALTASALMVGISLVVAFAALGGSVLGSIRTYLEGSLGSDYVVQPASQNSDVTFSKDLPRKISEVPGVESTTSLASTFLRDGEEVNLVFGVDESYPDIFRVDYAAGGPDAFSRIEDGGALIGKQLAETRKLGIGDEVELPTPDGPKEYTVEGILENDVVGGGAGIYLSKETLARDFNERKGEFLAIKAEPGTDRGSLTRRIEGILRDYPQFSLYSNAEWKARIEGDFNRQYVFFYAIMGVSVAVSAFGVVNTLSMSVFERTREIGILRAVGTTRLQVGRLVIDEGIVISLIGCLVGVAVGSLLGYLFVLGSGAGGFEVDFFYPKLPAIAALLSGLFIGVFAGLLPARSAARKSIVEAVQYE